jgi:hypothetical protein
LLSACDTLKVRAISACECPSASLPTLEEAKTQLLAANRAANIVVVTGRLDGTGKRAALGSDPEVLQELDHLTFETRPFAARSTLASLSLAVA